MQVCRWLAPIQPLAWHLKPALTVPLSPQFGDLEILYVVFDILYLDTGSVINRTLTERQELLRQTLAPQQTETFTIGALSLLVLSLHHTGDLQSHRAERMTDENA